MFARTRGGGGGALGYFLGARVGGGGGGGGALGYFLGAGLGLGLGPGTPNWHPVLEKISPKIDTPF